MRTDWRWLIVFAGNALFLFIVEQANHYFSRVFLPMGAGPVYVFVLGLPVTFAALRLSLGHGLAAVVLTGFSAGAATPLPPGSLMLACAAAFCITVAVRGNFNRYEANIAILVALLTNLALAAVLTFLAPPPPGLASVGRLLVDLSLSQIAILALTGWFFSYQLALLRLFGIDLETELRQPT